MSFFSSSEPISGFRHDSQDKPGDRRDVFSTTKAIEKVLPMRCPRRLTLHHHAENAVDARLIALAVSLEPIEHVLIQTNGQLLFRRRPSHRCLFEKGLVEPRNVRLVDLGILYTVNRGWRDANRTAAGTAALQRRFPQRLKLLLILRQLRHGRSRALPSFRRKVPLPRQPWNDCPASLNGLLIRWSQVDCDRLRGTSLLIASYANRLISFPSERIVLSVFHIRLA
jgi:hypothetical protein